MKSMDEADERIIEILKFSDCELRSSEIRNQLLVDGFSDSNFYVKVCRKLKSLVNRGIVERRDKGHKNVIYSLSADHEEKMLREQDSVVMKIMGLGIYKPGDSYEQFRAKIVKRLEQIYEWRKGWEELDNRYGKKKDRVNFSFMNACLCAE